MFLDNSLKFKWKKPHNSFVRTVKPWDQENWSLFRGARWSLSVGSDRKHNFIKNIRILSCLRPGKATQIKIGSKIT